MDARPHLIRIAGLMQELRLEGLLIGNAAAALQGAPVTTMDFDFMFRKTPANIRKLKKLADRLGAVILRPFYPASDLFRIVRDEDGLQIDFMATIHGVRSLASLRSRARKLKLGETDLMVASLSDIIKSKRAAGRPTDLAVLPVLEKALDEEKARNQKGQAGSPRQRE
jgi:hypothetical protein